MSPDPRVQKLLIPRRIKVWQSSSPLCAIRILELNSKCNQRICRNSESIITGIARDHVQWARHHMPLDGSYNKSREAGHRLSMHVRTMSPEPTVAAPLVLCR